MTFSRCVRNKPLINQNTCVLSSEFGRCERSIFGIEWSTVFVSSCNGYKKLGLKCKLVRPTHVTLNSFFRMMTWQAGEVTLG